MGYGQNTYGGLGDGSNTNRNVPVQILPSGVTEIAAGELHSLFVKRTAAYGQWVIIAMDNLEMGSDTTRLSPVEIVTSGVSKDCSWV